MQITNWACVFKFLKAIKYVIFFLNIGVTETVDRLLNSVKLPVYTWIGPFQLFIIIDNPEDLEILLSDPNALGKPYIYKFFKKDRGLVAADG